MTIFQITFLIEKKSLKKVLKSLKKVLKILFIKGFYLKLIYLIILYAALLL